MSIRARSSAVAVCAASCIAIAAVVSAQHMGGPSPEHLGRMLFFDTSLSANGDQSCASCHDASAGFSGPDSAINAAGAVYEGSIAGRFGNRKPPSAAYAMLVPRFDYGATRGFSGGNFSDGRATGFQLGTPIADQAQAPFLNALEHALPDAAAVVQRACAAHYGRMLRRVFGASACTDVDEGYAAIAEAIAAFESSVAVSPFSSKYDAMLNGQVELSTLERRGLELFNGKARCATCHERAPAGTGRATAFSDFSFHNIGVPRNPQNPFYAMASVTIDGKSVNPDGNAWVDPGLGGFLEQLATDDAWRAAPYVAPSVKELTGERLRELAHEGRGKHRVPTLRNVDQRPYPELVKAFTHNGYFKTLAGLVRFFNTRDVLPRCATPMTEAQALANKCWPEPEVAANVNTRDMGNLGLSAGEEAALVAFLATLYDGFGGSSSSPGHRAMGCGMMR